MKQVVARAVAGILVLGALASVQPLTAQAPAGPAPKIGFVNATALLQGMPGYAAADSVMQKELAGYQAEIAKLKAQFDSAAADYEQGKGMMTAAARAAKEKTLGAMQDKGTQRQQDLQAKAQSRQTELFAPLEQKLQAIIDGIRAEGNYVAIFDVRLQGIISYDKAADITQKVVQRLLSATPGN